MKNFYCAIRIHELYGQWHCRYINQTEILMAKFSSANKQKCSHGGSQMAGFESITSLNSYVRTNEMTRKWTLKKDTGDMTADGTMSVSEAWRQKKNAQDKLIMQGLIPDQNEQKENDKLTAIRTKMSNGEELTPEELALLKEKDPQAYQSEMERRQSAESYKRDLSNAKTKEEFQRIRMSRASANMTRLNAVKNDSAIPDSAKLAIYGDINARLKTEREIERKFVESGEYGKLPTEREKAEAEQATREEISGTDETRKETEQTNQDQTEQTDTLNKSDQTVTADDKNQPVQNNTLNQTIQRDPSDQKKQTNVTVAESKHQQAHDRIRQESDNSASRLKSEADRAVSEANQKSEAELDEIRRKVNRAKQRRDKFIQTDTNDASDSQVSFQV